VAKKIICAAMVFLVCLFGVALPAFAAQKTYKIEELKLSVSLPDYYDVALREAADNSDFLQKYNMTDEALKEKMQQGDYYLIAINTWTGNELTVSGYENEFSLDVWSVSNAGRKDIDTGIDHAREYLSADADITIRTVGEYSYWYYTYETDLQELSQYATVENGTYMIAAIGAYHGNKLQDSDITALDSMIDTLSFSEILPENPNMERKKLSTQTIVLFVILAGLAIYMIVRILRRFKSVENRRTGLRTGAEKNMPQGRRPPPPGMGI
jgi:hypothetical protein